MSFKPSALITSLNDFVFGVSKSKSSTTEIAFAFNFKLKADLLANLLTFLLSFWEYDLTLGPKIVPPPLKSGFFILPALAVPVPFCFLIFLVLPVISALSLVLLVPWRLLAKNLLTSR